MSETGKKYSAIRQYKGNLIQNNTNIQAKISEKIITALRSIAGLSSSLTSSSYRFSGSCRILGRGGHRVVFLVSSDHLKKRWATSSAKLCLVKAGPVQMSSHKSKTNHRHPFHPFSSSSLLVPSHHDSMVVTSWCVQDCTLQVYSSVQNMDFRGALFSKTPKLQNDTQRFVQVHHTRPWST